MGLRLLLAVVGAGADVGVVGGGSFSPGERSVKDQNGWLSEDAESSPAAPMEIHGWIRD